uniref:SAM-dependent methyltransferase n=1 Tax=mine drainage metagenome TaxID=410659 RepID=E6QKZ4_9ZZZZ
MRPAKPSPANAQPLLSIPHAIASRSATDRLRRGHLWVYATEVEHLNAGAEAGANVAPALLPVIDTRGILLGTALYSPASQIPLRMVSREHIDEAVWLALLADRLDSAIALRKPLLDDSTNACRLVFSEADYLPGIILDKYADLVVVQLLARGLDSAAVRAAIVTAIRHHFDADCPTLTLWERPDPRIRALEGMSAPADMPLYAAQPSSPAFQTIFLLNGFRFHFDVQSGQKTGAFLDQRENYAAVARWAKAKHATAKVLDVCTYQGGFALHLAQVCQRVTGIDASRASLEVAETNLAENRDQLHAEVDWIEADAFALLREMSEPKHGSEASREWDLIVLDPPAFAKSKRAVEGALRGYKELNLRALRMLRPGGLLVTCSCSHHVTWANLEAAVADAAIDAHRTVRILDRRGAAIDHPVVLNLPETEYLKCLICEVV